MAGVVSTGCTWTCWTWCHFSEIGLDVPDFNLRKRCYELAIGLDGMAYQAFACHWDDLAWTTRPVAGLLTG